ncbi:MAG: hypothetical protein JWM97_2054 [Phycisphaerales bacterium]|nr:hypothetical protein [Phycisphaerales bacterium]
MGPSGATGPHFGSDGHCSAIVAICAVSCKFRRQIPLNPGFIMLSTTAQTAEKVGNPCPVSASIPTNSDHRRGKSRCAVIGRTKVYITPDVLPQSAETQKVLPSELLNSHRNPSAGIAMRHSPNNPLCASAAKDPRRTTGVVRYQTNHTDTADLCPMGRHVLSCV